MQSYNWKKKKSGKVKLISSKVLTLNPEKQWKKYRRGEEKLLTAWCCRDSRGCGFH